MKTTQWLIAGLAAWGMWVSGPAWAEETAMVQGNRVNVRGQPSLAGEVITQLKEGETISILETIALTTPKPGEPTNWFRIRMPVNTPVWVHRSFIEPTNKTVLPPRLNVRAGPGENFSVVGRLPRGETVKEIRVVDNWMEIETPSSAYGFVAAEWIQRSGPDQPVAPVAAPLVTPEAPAPKVVEKPEPATPGEPSVVTTPPVIEKPELATPPPLPIQVEIATLPPEPTVATPPTVSPAETPPSLPMAEPKAAAPEPATLPPVVPPPPRAEEKSTRRVVVREGIVRSTISIQAPTYYELVSPQTRKTINYLHSSSTNLVLKTFRGLRVQASGEEFLDARWPNTPVLEVETVELAP